MDKTKVVGVRDFFIEQKYRFDQGIQFLSILNFTLLVIASSDQLKGLLPFRTNQLVLIFVPSMFFGVWIFGFILERFVKFPQASERTRIKRSPSYIETQEKLDEIIELLKDK